MTERTVTIVTGAASGIGAACVRRLADREHRRRRGGACTDPGEQDRRVVAFALLAHFRG